MRNNTFAFCFKNTFLVGKWIEKESRKIDHQVGYYDSDYGHLTDYEVLQTIPGEYELRVGIEGMTASDWILVKIPTNRIEGATYSYNFPRKVLPLEPVNYVLQDHFDRISGFVLAGKAVLHDRLSWLLQSKPYHAPKWDELQNIHAEMLELNIFAK